VQAFYTLNLEQFEMWIVC